MAKCNHYFSWNGFYWVCVGCGARRVKNPYEDDKGKHKEVKAKRTARLGRQDWRRADG